MKEKSVVTSGHQVNMAGFATSLMANISCKEQIIDSGHTHHIASDLGMLKTKTKVSDCDNDQVHLPT